MGVANVTVTNVNLMSINSDGAITWSTNQYFVLDSTSATGQSPRNLITADIKGNGSLALITVNNVDNTLSVLTNNGSGVFALNGTYAVGWAPESVVAADVNNDGKVDLICANYGATISPFYGYTLTVLTNNGSGIFGSHGTYSVGYNPDCVIAADVNGDGRVDLISANYHDSTLTVLTNNGSGKFSVPTPHTALTLSLTVAAADVNGDGKMDLISANYNCSIR